MTLSDEDHSVMQENHQHIQPEMATTPGPDLEVPATSTPESLRMPLDRQATIRSSTAASVDNTLEDFRLFITFVFGVSIFGAATFAVVVGQMTDPADLSQPDDPVFSLSTVRTFLAAAWLCFILALALAGYSSSALLLARNRALKASDDKWAQKWEPFGVLASAVLHLLLVVAFMFLSLGIVPYASGVGWAAVGFTSLASTFVLCLCTYQIWNCFWSS